MCKKIRGRNIFVVLLAMLFVVAMSMTIFANPDYTPVAGTSTTFNKYLIVDSGDTIPNATFSFTVAPGTAIPSSSGVMEVMAGIGTPTIADVTFSPSDTTSTSTTGLIDIGRTQEDRTGTAGTDLVQFDSGEKFATKAATISFTGITFAEPGIYRYIITETASAAHASAGIIHDTDTDRVLDVYVTDDGTGVLSVSSYALHTDVNTVPAGTNNGSNPTVDDTALTDKTDGFTNEYSAKDLRISKAVDGNQASRDKFFALTVTCANVADADSFVVSIVDDNDATTNDGNAHATSGSAQTGGTIAANAGKTNSTSVTGAELKAGKTFYLSHGENVVIRGLPLDATYYVTENAEDYKSEVMSGKTNGTAATPAVIGTVAGSSKIAEAGFLNTRNGVIPTGIFATVGVGALIILFGLVGIVFGIKNSKRRYN